MDKIDIVKSNKYISLKYRKTLLILSTFQSKNDEYISSNNDGSSTPKMEWAKHPWKGKC